MKKFLCYDDLKGDEIMKSKNFIRAYDSFCNFPDTLPAPILRKSFNLSFTPDNCELNICVSGFYELVINGINITKGFLAPFISNPDQLLYYDTYDLTPYLIKGENIICVTLGNGFANQDFNCKQYCKASHRAPLAMALNLKAIGGEEVFELVSDESFKVNSSPIIYDMYHLGTIYDARREDKSVFMPGYDDSSWENAKKASSPKGDIFPSFAMPVKVRNEITPVSIKKQENIYYFYDNEGKPFEETFVKDAWCYDFGVSRAGVCKLKIKGKRGQKVTLRHCETLKNGNFCMNSIHSVNEFSPTYFTRFQADTYILKGGEEEIYIPSFTYHGFRYVLCEGITKQQATKDLLTFEVLSTETKKRAYFSCSNDTLNTIYNMAVESDLSNYQHIITDCPHREKCGWTGDISVSAHQFLLSFNCVENLKMWLQQARYSQTEKGALPCVIPSSGWGYNWGNGPVWDSAILNVVYHIYKYYGRVDVIEENADMIIRYLRYIADRRDEKGLIAVGLPDWCQPGKKDSQPDSPLVFTDSSQIYHSALRSAFLFEIIGRNNDAEYARKLGAEMKKSIRNNLIDFETMTVAGNCQTSQAVALNMGLFEKEEIPFAYKRLKEIIQRDDYKINCGMIGLRNIFHVLAKNGDIALAVEMITKKNAPSYQDMIDRGGTALFESMTPNGFQESQNHHFYGDVINLFITKIAGLNVNPNMNDIYEICLKPYGLPNGEFVNTIYTCGESKLIIRLQKFNDKFKYYVLSEGAFYGTVNLNGKIMELKKGLNVYEY